MKRARSRWLLLTLTVMLVVSMSPVGTASGVMVGGGESVEAAAKTPTVSTSASQGGIRIKVRDLPRDVQSFDLYRSESVLVEGDKLNTMPIVGRTFVDSTAQAGVQYYYTVKIATRGAGPKAAAATVDVPEALPQVKADVAKARPSKMMASAAVASSGGKKNAEVAGSAAVKDAAAASAQAISQMSVTIGSASEVTTLAASATWTPAGGPYFIRGDFVVPAGKTLTILPGTKVYFDTEPAGSATATYSPAPGVQSVTPKIDLVVHGKLIAKGASTNPILFSSINSTVESSAAGATVANNGDWGCVFVDSADASEVSYATFEYGKFGIWAHNTLRPYVSYCTFRNVGIDAPQDFPWAAVSFTNPPKGTLTTPRIRITNNSIAAVSVGEGINVTFKATGANASDRVVDPYIAYNNIRGNYGICLQADESPYNPPVHGGTYGNTIVKGTLVGNTVNARVYAVYGYSDSGGDKSGTWMPAFSGNTLASAIDNAVWVNQDAMGVGGDAYVKPTFSKDVLSGQTAVYLDAASNSSSVSTSVGDARVTPTFTSCTLRSRSGSALDLLSNAQASGAAISEPVVTGGKIEVTSGEGVYAYSSSNLGAASSSPSMSGVTGRGVDDYDFVSCDSRSTEGNAKSNPRWIGGSIVAGDDDGIYAYAYAGKGSAEARPYVSDTEIVAEDYCVDAEAYASQDVPTGTGNANASGTIRNSRLVSNEYDAYYGEADTNGTGSAVCSPAFTNADLTAEDYYATELYVQSAGGPATCSPLFTDTSTWSYDGNLIDVARAGEGTKSADVNVAPKVTGSVFFAKYDDAYYIDADNSGVGNCYVKPSFTYSDIINSYSYEGLDASADVATTGTAECSPIAVGTNFVGDYGAIYTEAVGADDGSYSVGKANGSFTDCSFSAAWDDAVYNYAYTVDGYAEVKPTYTRCVAEAHDSYAYEFDGRAEGDPAKATVAPVISGGRILNSAYGIGVWAYSWDLNSEGTWTVAPRILNVPVNAHGDYGIYTWALTEGYGTVANNSYVYNCPTNSEWGIIHEAIASTLSTADATNTSKTLGVSAAKRMPVTSMRGNGVYSAATSALGSAVDRSEMKYLAVSASSDAFCSVASASSGATETAVAAPVISGNVNDTGWGAAGNAVYVYGAALGVASTSTVSPTIASNSLSALDDYDGIWVFSDSTHPGLGPVVSGNTIKADSDGIYVAGSASDMTGTATITKNSVANPKESGIYIDGLPMGRVEQNRIVNPGWGYDGTQVNWYASGIVWNYADPSKALVRGNLVAGARGSGVYYPNGAAKTNFNSFGDCAGNLNRPFNYWTDQPATSVDTPFDATRNWWGTATTASILKTINTPSFSGNATEIVNAGLPLTSCQPKVTSLVAAKSSTKVTFTIKFDRAMDPAIRTLYFGKSSPYRSYKVTGSWYKDAAGNYTTFKGTRARSGLPTGVKLYFSGAKDLPGNLMLSTSRYVKL